VAFDLKRTEDGYDRVRRGAWLRDVGEFNQHPIRNIVRGMQALFGITPGTDETSDSIQNQQSEIYN
jgi:hypothetical protein